ncbi:MAG: SMC family ATPase [Rothia sp. (in: high G+C Gram-positive bacteria)]|uniref:AAA family ATPase n=1 Tax=Rothia sp. (in: high G+C Gram-positive bacteria) TaxID=1885016 RepID=UPI0026E07373|nr:SMC family ATPase [Rothia sp. (in: high G+C Gram-positive bacteria)]MDO5750179.1 SMC family ATPase [Rothia sp. (in: high G+C Gram-positive bacteria)]
MRLHVLEFSAFMSYPGEERIDFDALNDSGMFLLSGPTGAGKTTVLEALSYALYGQTTSGSQERDPKALASTFADFSNKKLVPRVYLDATINGVRVRIERFLEFQRPGNKNATASKVEVLSLIPGANPDLPESWQLQAAKAKDAGIYLDELIQLSREQFMKVILLPQGEFSQFLQARSDERQAMLAKLFPVDIYSKLQQELEARAKEQRQAVGELRESMQTLQQRAVDSVAAAEENARDMNPEGTEGSAQSGDNLEEVEALNPAPSLNPAQLNGEEFLAWLDTRLDTLDSLAHQLKETQSLYDTRESEYAQSMQAAREQIRVRTEYAQLEQERAAHLAQSDSVRSYSEALAEHERALPVSRAAEAVKQSIAELKGAYANFDSAALALQQQAAGYPALAELRESHPEQGVITWAAGLDSARISPRDVSRETLHQQLSALSVTRTHLQQLRALEQDLNNVQSQLSQAHREVTQHQQTEEQLTTNLTQAESQQLQVQQSIAELANAPVELSRTQLEYEQARQALEAAQKYTRDLKGAEQSYAQAQQTEANALAQASSAAAHLAQLYSARMSYARYILAAELKPGEACSVCGSHEHPAPAQLQDAEAGLQEITEATLEAARAASESANAAHSRAVQALAAATTTVEALRAAPLDEAAAAQAFTLAQNALQQAQVRAQQLVQFQQSQQQLLELIQSLTVQKHAAAQALAGAHSRGEQLAQQAQQLETQLQSQSLSITIAQRIQALDMLSAALTQISDIQQEQIIPADFMFANRTDELEQVRAISGYAEIDDALAKVLEPQVHADYTRAVTSWTEQEHKLQARAEREDIQRLVAQLESEAPVDSNDPYSIERYRNTLAQLEELSHENSAQRTRYAQAFGALNAQLNDIQQQRAEYMRLRESSSEALHREELYENLARAIVRGESDTGPHRSDLVNYVLGIEFSRVLEVASDHLQRMSNNRYRMVLHDRKEGRTHQGGLGIDMHDQWNDQHREVRSLSGGESFLASLALALGLAEVVQSRSGGIEMDTLFIDEGFGSLDQDSLDSVMDVLEHLRDNGRLVGLISHVDNMKERIDTQLVVTKTPSGSSLETIIG